MSDPTLVELFLEETRTHAATLSAAACVLASGDDGAIARLVHAAHSVRGAAVIVGSEGISRLAAMLETALNAARRERGLIAEATLKAIQDSAELLADLGKARADTLDAWERKHEDAIAELARRLTPKAAPSTTQMPDVSMVELFRMEVEAQAQVLSDSLLALESSGDPKLQLERAMRAAHSIKGASRILQLEDAVRLSHVMEDYLVEAQRKSRPLPSHAVDVLLGGVDVLTQVAEATRGPLDQWMIENHAMMSAAIARVTALAAGETDKAPPKAAPMPPHESMRPPTPPAAVDTKSRIVRVSAESMTRLMGFAGEMVVEARRMQALLTSLSVLRERQRALGDQIEALASGTGTADEARRLLIECRGIIDAHGDECDGHSQRSNDLSSRIYREAMSSRMRPFADGMKALPRMVRDVARSLGKSVKLEVIGQDTKVDRDILEKLDAPLNHLLRNAVDHGIEMPAERKAAGKPEQATIRVEARHRAGTLSITISDDGRGVDLGRLRARVRERELFERDVVDRLSEAELLDCIFLPGLSTAKQVTDLSGRGVGLDVVKRTVQEVGGSVRVHTEEKRGTSFHLQLPLTLSVIRAVLVDVAGDPYAVPLTRVDRVVTVPTRELREAEGRHYFSLLGKNVGLVEAQTLLDLPGGAPPAGDLTVVIVSMHTSSFGLRVTKLLGEVDLVVRPLDARLGDVRGVSSAALLPNGQPLLILDVDDVVRTIESMVTGRGLRQVALAEEMRKKTTKKQVLVVDDSITVREVERQILKNRGYAVDVAVDGADGLQAARRKKYDLIITDVDMPRMNGIELVRALKQDERLRPIPVMIVSYKERPEDRARGMDAGASYYLTKGSFDDEALVDAVIDLIGEAET